MISHNADKGGVRENWIWQYWEHSLYAKYVWIGLIKPKMLWYPKCQNTKRKHGGETLVNPEEVGSVSTKQNEDAWCHRGFRGDRKMVFINCSHRLATAETHALKQWAPLQSGDQPTQKPQFYWTWAVREAPCRLRREWVSDGKPNTEISFLSYMPHKIILNGLEAIHS